MRIENPASTNNFVYAVRLSHDLSQEFRYVGITSRGHARFKDHLRYYNRPNYAGYDKALYRWFRKHFGRVTFEILEECPKELLFVSEMKWVHILRQRGHRLLNATEGGEGFSTYTPTPEHRLKMRENLQAYLDENGRPRGFSMAGEKNGMYGRKHSEQSKGLMSEAKLGKPLSEEHRRKISQNGKGKGGRDTSGTRHPASKLTDDQVKSMRQERSEGASLKSLSEKYNTSAANVSRIALGQAWTHLL